MSDSVSGRVHWTLAISSARIKYLAVFINFISNIQISGVLFGLKIMYNSFKPTNTYWVVPFALYLHFVHDFDFALGLNLQNL